MALTAIQVKNAKTTDKPIKLSDGGGLFLLVQPNGSRYWRFAYRFSGKQKTLALGVYPDVSLVNARERRNEARKLLVDGIDPGENRKATKTAGVNSAANSFEVVAREWHGKFSPGWAATHSSKIIRRLEIEVFPWLGARPIAEITAPELLTCIRKIEARGTLETAHRTLQHCGQVFRYAVQTGRTDRDPSGDLRGALPPVRDKKHFVAVTEPKQVAELLRVIDGYKGSMVVCCALKLAPMVFVRPGELRTAQWSDIDLDAAEWRYTVSKTKTAHIVPLATQAVVILRDLYALTGNGRFVFPGARSSDRAMCDNGILAAMRRMGIPKEEMSGHGFRALARTILDEVMGVRPELIEHQLAHAVRDPLGRAYNRTTHLPERKKMMQQWADYLDQLKAGAIVIPLHSKSA
ncbi:MAG: tyrosine-type recombinase/integrase [Sulfuricella sp.]